MDLGIREALSQKGHLSWLLGFTAAPHYQGLGNLPSPTAAPVTLPESPTSSSSCDSARISNKLLSPSWKLF